MRDDYTPRGKADPAEPLRLTKRQQAKADRWLVDNCAGLLRPHTATYMANGISELLGIGIPPLDYESVLHPLCATVRQRCAELGIEVRKLTRDDEGLGTTVNPARRRTQKCAVCGKPFDTHKGRLKTCDACRAKAKVSKVPKVRLCAHCGAEFRPRVHNARYCSQLCARDEYNRWAREKRAAGRQKEAQTNTD